MRNYTLNINREYALEGLELMNKFQALYIKEHGMEYMQEHYREYEAERSEYIRTHRSTK